MWKAVVVIAVLVVLLGLGLSRLFEQPDTDSRPHCPQEDSCVVDYHDHQWFINGKQVTK